MHLSQGQKWFIIIVLCLSMSFFIITTALTMFPPRNSFSTPDAQRMSQYIRCISQAGSNFYGDAEKQAVMQCMQLFEQFNMIK